VTLYSLYFLSTEAIVITRPQRRKKNKLHERNKLFLIRHIMLKTTFTR